MADELDDLIAAYPDVATKAPPLTGGDDLDKLIASYPDAKPAKPLRGTEAFGGRIPGVPEPEKPLALQSDEEQASTINRAIAQPTTAPGATFKPMVVQSPNAMPGTPPKEDLENLAISMGLEGVAGIAASKVASVAQAAKLAQTAVSTWFATTAGWNALKTSGEARDLYKKGDYMGAVGKLGQAGTEAVIATLAGLHARGEFKGAADIAKTENVLRENLKAQETARAAQERADAAAAQAKAPKLGTEPPVEPPAAGAAAGPEPAKPGPTSPLTPDPLAEILDEAPPVAAEHGYTAGQIFDTPEGTYHVERVKGGTVVGKVEKGGKKRPFLASIERFKGLVGPAAGQVTPPTKTEQAGEVSQPESFKDVGKAGTAIVDNMYDALWDKVEKGDVTEAGQPSAILQAAKKIRDNGGLQSIEEFKSLAKEYASIPRDAGFQQSMRDLVEKHVPTSAPPVAAPTLESSANSPTIAPPEAAIAVPTPSEVTIPEAKAPSSDLKIPSLGRDPLSPEPASPGSAPAAVAPESAIGNKPEALTPKDLSGPTNPSLKTGGHGLPANSQSLGDTAEADTLRDKHLSSLDIPFQDTKVRGEEGVINNSSEFPSDLGGQGQSPDLKGVLDGNPGDATDFGDLVKTKAFSEHSLGGFNTPTQRIVLARVVAALHDQQVRERVIQFVPVEVVDDLVRLDPSTAVSLHDKAVLIDPLSVNRDASVSIRSDIADAIVRELASSHTDSIQTPTASGPEGAAQQSAVKDGDRVQWKDPKGTPLSGTVRSVNSDGTASIDTDQIVRVGGGRGIPIGRVETVPVGRLTAETPNVAAEPEKTSGAPGLIDAVYGKLKSGESLGNVTELTKLAEQHFGSARTSGEWSPKDMFDAMEAGINKHLLDQGAELMAMPVPEGLAKLRELMDRITSQGVRTEEQLKKQQFSTPPTESYLAARVGAVRPDDVVLEPSAGNGGLVIWAKAVGAEVHVNEISERRAAMMKAIGLPDATFFDGEVIAAFLDRKIRPTLVLMNPPFSAGAMKSGPARNRNLYGFNHVDSALQTLLPGGRLVAILGGGQANEPDGGASLTGGKSGEWFKKIAGQYTVRANVRIHGKEYQKYGTSFATRLIVIDKTGPTADMGSVVKGNVDTLEEAYNLLRDVAASRAEIQDRAVSRPSAGEGEPGTGVGADPSASVSGEPGVLQGGEAGGQVQESADRPQGPRGSSGGLQSGPRNQPTPRIEPAVEPAGADVAATPRSVESGDQDVDLERPLAGTETNDAGLSLDRVQDVSKSEEEDATPYATYKPTITGPDHPGDIVETKTMATIPLPALNYKPNLPEAVITNKKLSAVQLEAISIAGAQNSIVLPGGFRASALVGDGTGVGKGRIGAGILWDNYRRGRKRLVWVSEKWDLMQAAIGDFENLGATELTRGITKQNGKFIAGPNAAVRPFAKFASGTKIEHDGVIFTTYALIRSEDSKGNRRVSQIEQYLRGDDDGDGAYIIFDEAHNLKNAVPAQGTPASQIGKAVKELLERMPKLRTSSMSATAATEVRNLGYLDRLGLWGPGTPFPNGFSEFQNQVASGGMAAMELIARELKAQGKYISRTLSFKGVTYDQKEHQLTDDQKELFRSAVRAWGSVVQNAEATIRDVTNGGAFARGRFMSLFYGAQLRFFNVLITTLKIPSAIEVANKALSDGKSVVISLVNTNEAAQNREKNKARDLSDEDEIPDYDFGPKEMLVDLVRQHYPVQQFTDDVDANGNPIKVPVYRTDEEGREIPVTNPEAERRRDELIGELNKNLHMPDNPLDILIQGLGGDKKVAEMTGRKERYDRGLGKFVSRGDPGTKRDDINLMEMAAFQGGKKRVAVLSNAAGTGISLHAGNDVTNKQKRTMITLQVGWSADKQMQMFGRVHRTNQSSAPEYVFLVSDLGGEKRFVSTIARRLGSLGALTKGQKNATSGTDLMEKVNFETDQGRQATNSFYTAMLRNQPVPGTGLTGMQVLTDLHVLKTDPQSGRMTVPREDMTNVTRLLNRLLALDPDVQNGVYNFFYDIFQAAVQDAIDRGTLDTGVKTLPGDEFTIKEQRSISKDPKTNADTFYYNVEAKERRPRVSVKELDDRIRQHRSEDPTLWTDGEHAYLTIDANPIVHEDGKITNALYLATPGNGKWAKVPASSISQRLDKVDDFANKRYKTAADDVKDVQDELDWRRKDLERRPTAEYQRSAITSLENKLVERNKVLADAQVLAVDPTAWAKHKWGEEYESSPSHVSVDHHMIGGAVMRWWNPIKDSTYIGHSIYTTQDSKTNQRIVGIDIPAESIRQLLDRITGGQSTVTVDQLHDDILKNNVQYELEGGIQVRRGRIGRDQVIQLIPPDQDVARNLQNLGALYEKGITPVYYVPNNYSSENVNQRTRSILKRILDEYPVKSEPTATESLNRATPRDQESGSVPVPAVVVDAIRKAAAVVHQARHDVLMLVAPHANAPGTALTVRQRAAELARSDARAEAALEDARKALRMLPEAVRWDAYDRAETGRAQVTPELDTIFAVFRQLLDNARNDVQGLGTGKLEAFIENYLPHVYKNPQRAEALFAAHYAKNPMEGKKAFLKQRKYETLKEAMDAGLEPITDNPVDQVLIKVHEMQKYVMAHRILHDEKEAGRVKYYRVNQHPAGVGVINDKIATVFGPHMVDPQHPGMPFVTTVGHYYTSTPDEARIINNYLSPGIRGVPLYRGYLAMANTMNQFQLGFSAFHLGFVTMDAAISKTALGIYQAAHGHPLKGLVSIASTPVAPFMNIIRGDKMLKEYYKPGTQGGRLGTLVDAMVMAGGRARMDTLYQAQAARHMADIMRQASPMSRMIGAAMGGFFGSTLGQVGAAAGATAGATFGAKGLADIVAKPIMEYLVPRMKMGVFADLAEFELKRLGEGRLTDDEIQAALARAWDSVDNRMGQLVYDNIFWNKAFKDLLMGTIRSVGWNTGTIREVGGGVADLRKAVTSGDVSTRLSYLIALPLIAGIVGAIIHYLATGEQPETLKDYYFPRSGGRKTPEWSKRLSLPTYIKDIVHVREKGIVDTVQGKLHPFLTLIGDMLTNEDYYGDQIRNANDPMVKQAQAVAAHILESYTPMTMKPPAGKRVIPETAREKALKFVGITRAPKYIQDNARKPTGYRRIPVYK